MRGPPVFTERAQRLRREATDAERVLWWALRRNQLGWRFRRQYPIRPFIVDFACLEARLIVEADGSQHAEPGDHDRRDAILRARGWRVLRFWNIDILQNQEGVLSMVSEMLGPGPRQPPPL